MDFVGCQSPTRKFSRWAPPRLLFVVEGLSDEALSQLTLLTQRNGDWIAWAIPFDTAALIVDSVEEADVALDGW